MGCTTQTVLSDVTFDCQDNPIGGLTKLILANKSDVTYTITAGALTISAITPLSAVEISFSNKDNYTNFTDVLTAADTGVVTTVPTIVVEIPKMDAAKRNAITGMAKGNLSEIVAFVETSAGVYHVVGIEYGLYISLVTGTAGTGRTAKNSFQLTLTGLEENLAYVIDATQWAIVIGAM